MNYYQDKASNQIKTWDEIKTEWVALLASAESENFQEYEGNLSKFLKDYYVEVD